MDPIEREIVGIIREISEETRNVFVANEAVSAFAKTGDQGQMTRAVVHLTHIREATNTAVEGLLREARSKVNADPNLRDGYGDAVTRLRLQWSDVRDQWQTVSDATSAAALQPAVSAMLLECAYLTVPPRLNDNMREHRIGNSVDS